MRDLLFLLRRASRSDEGAAMHRVLMDAAFTELKLAQKQIADLKAEVAKLNGGDRGKVVSMRGE